MCCHYNSVLTIIIIISLIYIQQRTCRTLEITLEIIISIFECYFLYCLFIYMLIKSVVVLYITV